MLACIYVLFCKAVSVCLCAGGLDHLLHGATLRLRTAGQTETDIYLM